MGRQAAGAGHDTGSQRACNGILSLEHRVSGLTWITGIPNSGSWPFCITFIRGSDRKSAFHGFGADPHNFDQPGNTVPGTPGEPVIRVGQAGDWIFVLEEDVWPPQGTRPEVLRRVSNGTETVTIFQEIGKLNHEFAHASNGEIITAVTTSVPPWWRGTRPDRLKALAGELGMGNESDTGLSDLQVLLTLAERAFGISLDEDALDRPWPTARILPVLDDLPAAHPDSRVGDPELDLYINRAIEGDSREILSRRLDHLMRREGLANDAVLVSAVQSALAGDEPRINDDSPAGIALRKAAASHPGAVKILRLALTGRVRDALISDASLHERARIPGWREEFIADLGNPRISGADLRAAEDAERSRTSTLPGGAADTAPIRSHIQALLNAGLDQETICLRGGLPPATLDRIMSGRQPSIAGRTAQRILSLEIPSSDN